MREILLVSKPVAPPWNDSGKNLVRDLARGLVRYAPVIMTRRGSDPGVPGARLERLYGASAGGFAPALLDNAAVLARLAAGPRRALWHFFFAPNPRSSIAGAAAAALRRVPTVHTIASAPREDRDARTAFFADVDVVLSAHTEQRLLQMGVPRARIRRIAPCITPLAVPSDEARRRARERLGVPTAPPLVVYPGDLEFGGGARLVLEALAQSRTREAIVCMACRIKTPDALREEQALRGLVADLGIDARVFWIGETSEIHGLVGAADVVALPSTNLYAKMDYPLVVLEAMSMERAVVVALGTPAAELAERGGVRAIEAHAESLSAELDALLEDADARRALGEAARKDALARFVPEVMCARYEALYDEVLA